MIGKGGQRSLFVCNSLLSMPFAIWPGFLRLPLVLSARIRLLFPLSAPTRQLPPSTLNQEMKRGSCPFPLSSAYSLQLVLRRFLLLPLVLFVRSRFLYLQSAPKRQPCPLARVQKSERGGCLVPLSSALRLRLAQPETTTGRCSAVVPHCRHNHASCVPFFLPPLGYPAAATRR